MKTDSTIPIALLCNSNLLHFMLVRRLDGSVPAGILDVDNLSFEEACKQYAAEAFRRETGETTNEAFLLRWKYFRRHFPRMKKEGLVLAALRSLYEDFLEERRGNIHVKLERYGEWQNLIANINLGPIAAYAAGQAGRLCALWPREERERARLAMLNTNALCYPYDTLVEHYIEERGLNDTHLHIKACTFAEYNWLTALADPEHAFNPFAWRGGESQHQPLMLRAIRQQFCAIYGRSPAITILQHLHIARNLRVLLREYALAGEKERRLSCYSDVRAWVRMHTERLIDCLEDLGSADISDNIVNRGLFWDNHAALIRSERDWMSRLINLMLKADGAGQSAWVLPCFHAYLLLMNEYCSLFIQRETQKGFDEFNNTTQLELPNKLDKQYYLECFRHFHGSKAQSTVHYLDARFAPKSTAEEYRVLLTDMLQGYALYLAEVCQRNPHVLSEPLHLDEVKARIPWTQPEELLEIIRTLRPRAPFRYLRMGMTIHFIKTEWEREQEKNMRYGANRLKLREQSGALRELLRQTPRFGDFVRSVDAANDENNVPPSIFAPCFRFCRSEMGMERVTFHCGESFPHLLTGLRVMDDALRLLELRQGDRVGHGTALGMDPTYWRRHQSGMAYLRKEERMLDLLYAYGILKLDHHVPGALCEQLRDEMMELAHEIFSLTDSPIDPHLLRAAMDMRDLCPFCLEQIFPAGERSIEHIKCFKKHTRHYLWQHGIALWRGEDGKEAWEEGDEQEMQEDDAEMARTVRALKKAPPYAILLLLNWQFDPHTWKVGDQVIRVELRQEDDEFLLKLQRRLMQDFIDAKVVIETLITSNLRIACYRRAADHHAMRWLLHQPEKFNGEPDLLLCFGSDDPAIFSCDAKADFYLLYASLHEHGVKEQNALRLLDCVNRRGRIYSFPNPMEPLMREAGEDERI